MSVKVELYTDEDGFKLLITGEEFKAWILPFEKSIKIIVDVNQIDFVDDDEIEGDSVYSIKPQPMN